MSENHADGSLGRGSKKARRFVSFSLIEEALLSAALCIIYATYPDRVESWQVAAMVLTFLVAASAANAALFFENRHLRWDRLYLWQKAVQAMVAVATAYVAFLAAFASLGLLSGLAMGPRSLAALSGMAGFSFGAIGLFGIQLACDPDREGGQPGRMLRRMPAKTLKSTRKRRLFMCDDFAGEHLLGRNDEDWAGNCMPEELARVMEDVADSGGKASVDNAIRLLGESMAEVNKNDRRSDRRLVLRPVVWVDRFVMDCIVDEDGYFDLWENSAEELRALLADAESLLAESPSVGFRHLADHKSSFSDKTPAALAQRLNAYLCIAAGFAKDGREFDERLNRALDSTKANVDHLLSCWNADALVEMEQVGRYGFYAPGTRYWTEPLALLSYAAAHIGKARAVRRAYERYIEHLESVGVDLEGVRGRLMLDAEMTLGNLVGDSIDEIYPSYPLDFGATGGIRKLVADHPALPIVVFAGPEGTGGTYCEIDRAEVVELLNRRTCYYDIANVATNRDELVSAIEADIRDLGCVEGYDECWTDEQVEQAAQREAAKFDGDWVQAIAIHASWKDA